MSVSVKRRSPARENERLGDSRARFVPRTAAQPRGAAAFFVARFLRGLVPRSAGRDRFVARLEPRHAGQELLHAVLVELHARVRIFDGDYGSQTVGRLHDPAPTSNRFITGSFGGGRNAAATGTLRVSDIYRCRQPRAPL